jgi:hypothetical protein
MRTIQIALIFAANAVTSGCASAPPPDSVDHQLVVNPSAGSQPIADVEGPYGVVVMQKHAVALRVWPDGIDDGLADASLIVTNNSWNTLVVDSASVSLSSPDGSISVLDRDAMLARLDGGQPMAESDLDRTLGPLAERQSSPGVRSSTTTTSGARLGGEIDGANLDPALMAAAQRASTSDRRTQYAPDEETRDALRDTIDAWYLQRVEIYPGDTGTGGISFALPVVTTDLELIVALDGEEYVFDLSYTRAAR